MGAGRVPGARGPTLHQEVPCVHGLGDRQESQRRPRLSRRRGPAPGPLLSQDGGQPFASHLLPREGKIRPEPRSSQDRSAPAPERCAKGAWCCRVRTPPPAVPLPTPDQHPRPVRPAPRCPLAGLASTCPGRREGGSSSGAPSSTAPLPRCPVSCSAEMLKLCLLPLLLLRCLLGSAAVTKGLGSWALPLLFPHLPPPLCPIHPPSHVWISLASWCVGLGAFLESGMFY